MAAVRKRLVFTLIAVLMMLAVTGCGYRLPNTVQSTGDVAGKVIGALLGSPSIVLAEELGTAREYTSGEELMLNLKSGLLDCVIMEATVAEEFIADTSGVRMLPEPLLEYDIRFAVAKENTILLKAVNSALAALRENGTLRGLIDKYFAGRSYNYVPPADVEKRPGHLRLAVAPENRPYSQKDAEGVFTGLDIDVAQAVCDYLGVELRIMEFDGRELVNAVWLGWADLSLGWVPIEGEDLVDISEAYARSTQVVIVRR